MKKLRLLTVGRPKPYFIEAEREYLKRLRRYCLPQVVELADFPDKTAVKKESAAILTKLEGFNILLDVGGETVSSRELAALVDGAYLRQSVLTIVIGGSRGVDDAVRAAADRCVSFGRVTFPHQLMRVIALEQFYRAFGISSGAPYHK